MTPFVTSCSFSPYTVVCNPCLDSGPALLCLHVPLPHQLGWDYSNLVDNVAFCVLTMLGKLCIEVTPADKIATISEDLCIGCGICVKVRKKEADLLECLFTASFLMLLMSA